MEKLIGLSLKKILIEIESAHFNANKNAGNPWHNGMAAALFFSKNKIKDMFCGEKVENIIEKLIKTIQNNKDFTEKNLTPHETSKIWFNGYSNGLNISIQILNKNRAHLVL